MASSNDISFAEADGSMVQVAPEMFVTFVTWMVHDFCHDIDNSKSNGAFYNLFQAQNTKNRISKIVSHIVQNGGNPKNLSFQEKIDINCKSVKKIEYIPVNVPTDKEKFKIKFSQIYSDDIFETYQIIFNVLKDTIEDILSGGGFERIKDYITAVNTSLGFDIYTISVIEKINGLNNMMIYPENSEAVIQQLNNEINIMIEAIYGNETIRITSNKYLSMLLNPTEYFVKEYIEINYNFEDKSYMDPDILKNMAVDYYSCPYRFRIFIELIDKLPYEPFRESYLTLSNIFNNKFNGYDTRADIATGKLIQGRKFFNVSEEYLLDSFYEIINVITDNFLWELSNKDFDDEFEKLYNYISERNYFEGELLEGITLIKQSYDEMKSHTLVKPNDEFMKEDERVDMDVDDGLVDMDLVKGLGGGSYPHQKGGWSVSDTNAYTEFNHIIVNLKNFLDGYNPGGKYNIGNFDDTILDSIINPNDNLPYSDFVNEAAEQDKEKIRTALKAVLLLSDISNINKVTISDKLNELKENKKEFENNGKQMVCFINRTPPRMKLTDPLFLYTKVFDGLIFLQVYEIVWFIKKTDTEGVQLPNNITGYVPVYGSPLINYLIGDGATPLKG